MGYNSYSKRFQEVASLYIKDGEVIKYRDYNLNDVTDEQVLKEINHNNKVIIEKDTFLYCYFKDADKHIIENLITELKNKYNMMNIEDYVEFC